MRVTRSFHAKLRKVSDELSAGNMPQAQRDFRVFRDSTRRIWRGIAANLYSKWKPPSGCGVDDVEQELLLTVWKLLLRNRYDPTRGRTLVDYIVFNACVRTKDWLHKQRGANLHGNRDKHQTRAERTFSDVGLDTQGAPTNEQRAVSGYGAIAARMSQPATQEQSIERRESLLDLLDDVSDLRERFCLVALYLNGGSTEQAAHAIYGNPTIRHLCRFNRPSHARVAVRKTIEAYGRTRNNVENVDWDGL